MGFSGAFVRPFRPAFDAGAVAGVTWLLRDDFTTDDDAPITSPRTCEPGPGTFTIVDTGNRVSISGGLLKWTTTSAEHDPRVVGSTNVVRAIGLSCAIKLPPGNWTDVDGFYFGIGDKTAIAIGNTTGVVLRTATSTGAVLSYYPNDFGYASFTIQNFQSTMVIVCRTVGYLWIDYYSGVAKLVYPYNIGNTAGLVPFAKSRLGGVSDGIGYMRFQQLGAPYTDDYGIATNRTESAGAGATTTSEANAIIEATWTAVTDETYELSVRRTDDDNRWIIRGSQAGSTIKLIQREAGTETERASAAQTWTNGAGYRILVIQDGNSIKTYVSNGAVKNSYASASFNNTATGVKTSHAVSNLIAWPRTLSGAALTEMEKYTA